MAKFVCLNCGKLVNGEIMDQRNLRAIMSNDKQFEDVKCDSCTSAFMEYYAPGYWTDEEKKDYKNIRVQMK